MAGAGVTVDIGAEADTGVVEDMAAATLDAVSTARAAVSQGVGMRVVVMPGADMPAEAMLDAVTPVADSMAARFGVVAASTVEAVSTAAADTVVVDTGNGFQLHL